MSEAMLMRHARLPTCASIAFSAQSRLRSPLQLRIILARHRHAEVGNAARDGQALSMSNPHCWTQSLVPTDRRTGASKSVRRVGSSATASTWVVFAIAAVMGTSQSMAHHSGVMFDRDKQITLVGTVKQFQWTNPHCWIQIVAKGADGTSEWSIQMGAPTELFRGGWRPGTLRAGEKIQVVIHPSRGGIKAGMFISATGRSGEQLGKSAG
ncbi:MAG: DUF6152 family protein [Steroidobacteraceae bacterium]